MTAVIEGDPSGGVVTGYLKGHLFAEELARHFHQGVTDFAEGRGWNGRAPLIEDRDLRHAYLAGYTHAEEAAKK